jgi:type IV pilus assembly protein PilY1
VNGGVSDVADIGTTAVGVRWVDAAGLQYESTSHGCLCEGWGIAVNGTTDGGANVSGGTSGLTKISFSSTASTAESVVQLTGTDVFITHSYALSASSSLFEAKVKIENRGASDVTDVTYRRAMDWDTSPTPFEEFATIGGTATTTLLANSSDDGFEGTDDILSNPLDSDLFGCGFKTDFTGCGPDDHGAAFDVDFGTIVAGGAYDFSIFYGGAANKAAADAALGTVKAELFSYGWSNLDKDQNGFADGSGAITPTFIFAFKGVGGTIVIPDPTTPIPVPAAAWLMLAGLGSLGAMRRFKKA